MNRKFCVGGVAVFLFAFLYCSPLRAQTPIDDRTALSELQRLAAQRPEYSPEVAKKISSLAFQIWEKPSLRHQTATVLNMNHGYLDRIWVKSYLESLPEHQKDLPNFHKVTSTLFRGGQPTEAGFRKLRELGVKTVINLRAEDHSEESILKDLGIQSVWFPIPDTGRPTNGQITDLFKLLRNSKSGKFYIHCAVGISRTGTMVALWRIQNGMNPGAAFSEAVKMGFNEKALACDREAELIRNFRRR